MSTAGGRGMALKMSSGQTIFVPASLSNLTTWVILEQERWYEHELDFLARWLRPGMTAVDAVADLGVYALALAAGVGEEGRVEAFEPDRDTAALLEESKAFNRLGQLNVRRASNVALDQEAEALGLERLDFLRVGGEGVGARTIAGATGWLERWSPLVMFQVRPGRAPDLEAASALQSRGYQLYRALGDASMLVPWRSEAHEPWDINLFGAKPALAGQMEQVGLLAQSRREPELGELAPEMAGRLIARLPYLEAFGPMTPLVTGDPYVTALAAYEAWRDPIRPPAERYGALMLSLTTLQGLCAVHPSPGRLATLARVALEAGARQTALKALTDQGQFRRPPRREPFLATSPRFDLLRPGPDTTAWFTAQVFEQGELLNAYSSHGRPSQAENLAWLCSDSLVNPEMLRRLVMQHVRDKSAHGEALQALIDARPHLNARALSVESLRKLAGG
jgi:hypothetical protein